MKIIIKTLQGKQLPLEVNEQDTVRILTTHSFLFCDTIFFIDDLQGRTAHVTMIGWLWTNDYV